MQDIKDFAQKHKTKLIAGAILFLIISMVSAMVILTKKNDTSISNAPFSGRARVSDATLTVSGITVNNFYRESKEINKQGDQDLSPIEKEYDIVYFPKTESFLISVLSSPFEEVRQKAESKFLEKTKAPKTDACKLNVSITTPTFANPAESGQTYKLSFCN